MFMSAVHPLCAVNCPPPGATPFVDIARYPLVVSRAAAKVVVGSIPVPAAFFTWRIGVVVLAPVISNTTATTCVPDPPPVLSVMVVEAGVAGETAQNPHSSDPPAETLMNFVHVKLIPLSDMVNVSEPTPLVYPMATSKAYGGGVYAVAMA